MQTNDLKESRLEKLKKINEIGWNAYAHSYEKTHSVKDSLEKEGQKVKTAGRIMSFREHGNIAFANLKDETGKIQVFFQKKLLGDDYKNIKLLDIYIGALGYILSKV
jgi:lysyl-tRNA synthetase class 2